MEYFSDPASLTCKSCLDQPQNIPQHRAHGANSQSHGVRDEISLVSTRGSECFPRELMATSEVTDLRVTARVLSCSHGRRRNAKRLAQAALLARIPIFHPRVGCPGAAPACVARSHSKATIRGNILNAARHRSVNHVLRLQGVPSPRVRHDLPVILCIRNRIPGNGVAASAVISLDVRNWLRRG